MSLNSLFTGTESVCAAQGGLCRCCRCCSCCCARVGARPPPRGNGALEEPPWAGAAAGVSARERRRLLQELLLHTQGLLILKPTAALDGGTCATLAAPHICPPVGFPVRCCSLHHGSYQRTVTLSTSSPCDCRLRYSLGKETLNILNSSNPSLKVLLAGWVLFRGALFLSVPAPSSLRAWGTACPIPFWR